MVATTASMYSIANKGAQCAHSPISTGYRVQTLWLVHILPQNRGRKHWGRQGEKALLEDAVSASGTASAGRNRT